MGVNEWVVLVMRKMYEDATAKVRLNGRASNAFDVKVGAHQGFVLNPLLFIIVLEALSREFREDLPMELFHADDLVLMAESEELLIEKLRKWKKGSKQSECYSKAHTMFIIQLLLKLSYFISNFPGIDLDLQRSPKINSFIAIRKQIHDFLSNLN